jgi:hypothetical protein
MYVGGDLVAEEADESDGRQRPQVGELPWVDEALDRFVERDAGADQDRRDDEQAGDLLGAEAACVACALPLSYAPGNGSG